MDYVSLLITGVRGNKFVTFGVSAVNQRRQLVAEYDYTCIFEYAKGQRQVPKAKTGSGASPAEPAAPAVEKPQPRLMSFDDISVGDQLATLTVAESQEIIIRKNDFRLAGNPMESNIHTDEEFAKQNIFGGMVNSGPTTMSYIDQMLQLSFPLEAIYVGGSLLMRAIEPFRTTDVVTFGGEITEKRLEDERKIVSCQVKGVNQRGDLVCLADATLVTNLFPRRSYFSKTRRVPVMVSSAFAGRCQRISHLAKGVCRRAVVDCSKATNPLFSAMFSWSRGA